jgi:hypothetical protein
MMYSGDDVTGIIRAMGTGADVSLLGWPWGGELGSCSRDFALGSRDSWSISTDRLSHDPREPQ